MLTLVSIIQSGDIQNPELKPIIDDTIKSVLENVAYLSNIGE